MTLLGKGETSILSDTIGKFVMSCDKLIINMTQQKGRNVGFSNVRTTPHSSECVFTKDISLLSR